MATHIYVKNFKRIWTIIRLTWATDSTQNKRKFNEQILNRLQCIGLGKSPKPSWAKLSPRNALMNQFSAKGRIVLKDNRTFCWKLGIRIWSKDLSFYLLWISLLLLYICVKNNIIVHLRKKSLCNFLLLCFTWGISIKISPQVAQVLQLDLSQPNIGTTCNFRNLQLDLKFEK